MEEVERAASRITDLAEGIRLTHPGATVEDLPQILAESEGVSERTARRWVSRWLMGQPPKALHSTANRVWSAIERTVGGTGPESPGQTMVAGRITDLAEGIRLTHPGATVEDLPRILAESEGVSERTARRWVTRWLMGQPPQTRNFHRKTDQLWSAIEGIGSFGHDMARLGLKSEKKCSSAPMEA